MAAEKTGALGAGQMRGSAPAWSLRSWAASVELFDLSE